MEMNNTTTRNGDSTRVDPEEAKKLIEKTEKCNVIAVAAQDLVPADIKKKRRDRGEPEETNSDVAGIRVAAPRPLSQGKRDPKEEVLEVEAATRLGTNGPINIETKEGKTAVHETPDNATLKISRQKDELEDAAENKWNQNNSTDQR